MTHPSTDIVQTVVTDDDRHIIVHPVTGEGVDLEVVTGTEVVQFLEGIEDTLDKLAEFKRLLTAEVARRVDRGGDRTAIIDGVEFKVNAPTSEVYEAETIREAFASLVEADVIDQALLDKLVVWRQPKAPAGSWAVDKTQANKLKKHSNAKVIQALAAGRKTPAQPRKIEGYERIPDAEVVPNDE